MHCFKIISERMKNSEAPTVAPIPSELTVQQSKPLIASTGFDHRHGVTDEVDAGPSDTQKVVNDFEQSG